MRYMMKQEFWSLGDDYVIKDENERPVYVVDGKVFSWGDKLSFQDTDGNELAFISQKLLSFMPKYELHREGELFAEVKKEWSWFRSKFTLDVPGPNDYEITGSFWAHEYEFKRSGRTVATVSKAFWSWTDTYGVDIVEGEDDVAILATVVVIDLVCHDEKNH
ncbi:MAG: LURP-one-related/scramblase family protein [Planctomycetota bacterium]